VPSFARVVGIYNGTVLGEGGGIYSSGGVLTLVASTVKGNKATTAFDDIVVRASRPDQTVIFPRGECDATLK
jgi:hypothetical protein